MSEHKQKQASSTPVSISPDETEKQRTVVPVKPISMKKAMSLLDVSRMTLDRRVKEGTLTKYYLGGKPYLDQDEIEKAFEIKIAV